MNLEFGTSRRVIFGAEEFRRAGDLAAEQGKRAYVITGRSARREGGPWSHLVERLAARRVEHESDYVAGEPAVREVDAMTARARKFAPQVIIAIGGGSVLDTAKAVGALLTNGSDEISVRDFLEGVGAGKGVFWPSVPVIAIPTTAGTGSEVTKNAVIRSDDGTFKKSMRSPLMRPEVALVDPNLTMSAAPDITAASGLDAQTQLIESITSRRAAIFTDGLAWQGLELVGWALERVCVNQIDYEAREAMAMAALLSGITLDNAGLGAVHGLAAPIGGMFEIPHGVVCANLLPEITEANIRSARAKASGDEAAHRALIRYRRIACLFNGGFECEAEELAEFLMEQRSALRIPPLSKYEMTAQAIPRIVAECRGGSMKTNPVDLSDETLADILSRVLLRS
ncbi:iron-containing alcohol dehydrogenase [Candidatus Sumerlaeota bacterium]|nr:iron-containing alcohol dehydrogenase [Candidatus Sumerlaeota bacterium]